MKHYLKCPVDSGLLVLHKNSQGLYPVTEFLSTPMAVDIQG